MTIRISFFSFLCLSLGIFLAQFKNLNKRKRIQSSLHTPYTYSYRYQFMHIKRQLLLPPPRCLGIKYQSTVELRVKDHALCICNFNLSIIQVVMYILSLDLIIQNQGFIRIIHEVLWQLHCSLLLRLRLIFLLCTDLHLVADRYSLF